MDIGKIPVAREPVVTVGRERTTLSASSGKELPGTGPGKGVILFSVNGQNPATVRIKDT